MDGDFTSCHKPADLVFGGVTNKAPPTRSHWSSRGQVGVGLQVMIIFVADKSGNYYSVSKNCPNFQHLV